MSTTAALPPPPADRPLVAPFVVAHRAGNDLTALRRAQERGLALAEADLHLFRGRVEVRHLKTLGPVPILWDRWALASPWAPRLLLDALLRGAPPGVTLMLDLKGRDVRLASLLAAALREHAAGRPVVVCSRRWTLLEPLEGLDGVRVVHSVGSRGQLRALRRRVGPRRLGGVSIHRRLLDAPTVADLRRRAELVLSWPVETPEQARRLAGWGVDGLITERFDALAPIVARLGAARP